MPGPIDIIEPFKRHQATPPSRSGGSFSRAASLPESGQTTSLGFFVSAKRPIGMMGVYRICRVSDRSLIDKLGNLLISRLM